MRKLTGTLRPRPSRQHSTRSINSAPRRRKRCSRHSPGAKPRLHAIEQTRLPPRRKRRPKLRQPNSVPRESLTTRIRYLPTSGGAGSERPSTPAATFTRIVDGLVADFIGYSNARPNYAALIEIPLRLKEHATARREAAADPQALLAQIERRALLEAGVDAKEQILAEARHKLAVVDDTVEQKSEMLRKADEARAALVAGDSNPVYNEALTTIASADTGDSLANLYAEARRTPTDADEALIAQLESIDAKITRTEAEIANLRRAAVDLSRRRAEIEEVRQKFRRTGYDHPQSTFENDGDIGSVLGNVLKGAVRSGVLWDLMRQGHRARPSRGSADFGGSDFPFPFPTSGGGATDARGGEWRNPSTSGGWSRERSGSQRGSDGFSTGGAF